MPWKKPRRILCVRPDNMGDLLMSSPAIAALKETFNCRVTLLTSSMGKGIVPFLPAVDACMVWDVPWVKGSQEMDPRAFWELTEKIRNEHFDAAVIFTVFSQNPLPTALLLTLAGVPRRLAYCRENPYHLLTDWLPEEEPYSYIRHQVRRDLELVKAVGAKATNDIISIAAPVDRNEVLQKIKNAGVDIDKPWLILHPGVSEIKRQYPITSWVKVGRRIVVELGYQLIITGSEKEKSLASTIARDVGASAFDLSGELSLEMFIDLIRLAPLIVSVNTVAVHLAAAVQTKVVVLYALTNPQHAPWKTVGVVLPYSVPKELRSKNEILRFVQEKYMAGESIAVSADDVFDACYDILINGNRPLVEDIVSIPDHDSYGSRNTLNLNEP